MVRQYSWRSFSWLKIHVLVLKWLHNQPQNILGFEAQPKKCHDDLGFTACPFTKVQYVTVIMNFDNPCYVVTSILLQVVMIQKQRKKR